MRNADQDTSDHLSSGDAMMIAAEVAFGIRSNGVRLITGRQR